MSTLTEFIPLLQETALAWGIALTDEQTAQFMRYAEILIDWNQRMNLTALIAPRDIIVRHFLDSLSCARGWRETPDLLADIGSGAGFPGLALKIAFPSIRVVLVESTGKKANFLTHVVQELGLQDVTVLAERAETVARDPAYRECCAVVTARAVAELRVLSEYTLPFLRLEGRLLAPKGADIEREVQDAQQALRVLGGRLVSIEPVTLPGFDPKTLVVIEKIAKTTRAYPRSAGTPGNRPL